MTKKQLVAVWCIVAMLVATNIFQLTRNGATTGRNSTGRTRAMAVPTEKSALAIAQSLLLAISKGNSHLSKTHFEVSFDTSRDGWVVSGHLPNGYRGGDSRIVIRRSDAIILEIYLGK